VTGFGLLGHLLEMLRASAVDAVLDPEMVPTLEGALPLLARGITSSLHAGNIAALSALDLAAQTQEMAPLLIDPQTAGGLLAGAPADRAAECIAELHACGYRAALIGRVAARSGSEPRVQFEKGAAELLSEPLAAKGRCPNARADRGCRPSISSFDLKRRARWLPATGASS
jgi:selenophosphate synthase